jgi:uncharacterized protein (DUF1697 family)
MGAFVALLRAVNVGGHSPVRMAALCDLASTLGLERPRTVVQSGNLVFDAARVKSAELERRLEAGLKRRFGIETDVVVRTAAEWQRIIAANPFPEEAKGDPGHLLVMALKDRADPEDVRVLQATITGREEVRSAGAQLYIVYPDGTGRSKLTAARIERAVRSRGTARNWNTVLKLAAACADGGRGVP